METVDWNSNFTLADKPDEIHYVTGHGNATRLEGKTPEEVAAKLGSPQALGDASQFRLITCNAGAQVLPGQENFAARLQGLLTMAAGRQIVVKAAAGYLLYVPGARLVYGEVPGLAKELDKLANQHDADVGKGAKGILIDAMATDFAFYAWMYDSHLHDRKQLRELRDEDTFNKVAIDARKKALKATGLAGDQKNWYAFVVKVILGVDGAAAQPNPAAAAPPTLLTQANQLHAQFYGGLDEVWRKHVEAILLMTGKSGLEKIGAGWVTYPVGVAAQKKPPKQVAAVPEELEEEAS